MSKALYLVSWFLTGMVASTVIAWVGSYDALANVSKLLYFILFLFWVTAWLLDDPIIAYLKIESQYYYGLITGMGFALLTGGVIGCITFLVHQY